jgi:hypothetical protein
VHFKIIILDKFGSNLPPKAVIFSVGSILLLSFSKGLALANPQLSSFHVSGGILPFRCLGWVCGETSGW